MGGQAEVLQLKVQLTRIRPPVWRRLLVPPTYSLADLHDVIQVAFGWIGYHLHEFELGGETYGVLDEDAPPELKPEGRARLSRLAPLGTRFRYLYDFGDGWEHDVHVEKRLPRDPGGQYPRCTGGRRACPPEDVGGPWGYEAFLAALHDPEHPEHERYVEWSGGNFDPEAFDLQEVNDALEVADQPVEA